MVTERQINDMDCFAEFVVSQGLCVRCGACMAMCPQGAITLDEDYYPRRKKDMDCHHCGKCASICPGMDVDLPMLHESVVGDAYDLQNILGSTSQCMLTHSTHSDVRAHGSSGGAVTQILATLMELDVINLALVSSMSRKQPWRGVPRIARSIDELKACAQSKYTIIPQLAKLEDVIREGKPFALVGLPCQIQAFRKLELERPGIGANARLVVGLFCHMNVEMEGTVRLLQLKGIDPQDVSRIDYRWGKWPGKMAAHMKTGKTRVLHRKEDDFKDGAIKFLKLLYVPDRCRMCVDYTNVLADISVGDAWIRNDRGKYARKDGHSLTLVRTDRGAEMLRRVLATGDLAGEEVDMRLFDRHLREIYRQKLMTALVWIDWKRRHDSPAPEYHITGIRVKPIDQVVAHMRRLGVTLLSTRVGRFLGNAAAFSRLGGVIMNVFRWKREWLHRTQTDEEDAEGSGD